VDSILAAEATFPAPPPRPEAVREALARLAAAEAEARRWNLARADRLRAARNALAESLKASPEPPERLLDKRCPRCLSPYAAPTAEPRRWPLADVLAREVRRRGVAMLLIADEVMSIATPASRAGPSPGCCGPPGGRSCSPGTPFGGKASELYWLLRLTSPELRRAGLSEKDFVAPVRAAGGGGSL